MWSKTLRIVAASFVLSLLCVSLVSAQERTVQGTVTDGATGQPLPGANITIQGTQTGTTTDVDGTYKIQVPGPDAVLVFSFVGYQTREVRVGDQEVIDVTLQEKVGQLQEVVVTGYGTQERGNITGAMSSVDVAEANVGKTSSPQDLLQGRTAGVSIINNSGEPGAGMRIRVRGQKSLSANSSPLIVLDGVPISNTNLTPGGAGGASNSSNPLAMINPQNIESIQVLKGTAATSIYGSQGSNGVILIETKSGSGGSLQVNYTGKLSVGTPAKKLDLLTADEYRSALSNILGEDVAQQGPSTDWQEASTRTTTSQEHNLSFSGGTEQTSYRASLNYLNQEGILLDSGFKRVTGRLNASHSALNDRVRLNLNLTSTYMERNHAFYFQSSGFQGGLIMGMIGFDPTRKIREDGQFVEYSRSIRNPVALLKQITDFTDQRRILGNFSAEIDLLDNLTAKGTFGVDDGNGIRRAYLPKTSSVGGEFNGVAAQNERRITTLTAQSTLRYNRDLFGGAHSLNLLGGFEFQRETFKQVGVEVRDFITDAVKFNNLGSGKAPQPPFSNKERVDQVGFFGRLRYNIQDKYLLTATLRRDGSSVFGRNNKFAYFPSASVGWDVAQESFLDIEGLTQLKLRASYGISGNQGVPPYESLPLLTPGFEAFFGLGEKEVTGVAQARAARPDLKWEETSELNLGLDFTYGRFDGTVNYYRSKTEDLLLNTRVLQPAPSSFVLDNVGSVSNRGIEFSLEWLALDRENTSLTISANASSNFNNIESLGGRGTIDHAPVSGPGLTGVDAQRLEPGHPIGSFYGPVFTGINENGQETYLAPNGGTTTSEEEAVKKHLGNPIPDVAYGLNFRFQYHGFDASAFFRGEQGREIFNNTALIFATKSNLGRNINLLHKALEDGTAQGHQPTYSSRWIQNASFLRLDKLTVGYNLPNASRYNLRRARIYVSASNLLVITPYSGYDPELNSNVSGRGLGFRSLATPSRGIDWTSYPRPRTFTLGVEFGF